MINLLPEKEKSELLLKRIKNLSLVLGAITIIFLFCLVLILLSLKFYMLADVDNQKYLFISAQEKYKTPDMINFKNVIEGYNKSFPIINSFYKNQNQVSETLAVISAVQKPSGVHFTSILVDNKNKVSISGISDTRENLIIFQKNLENQTGIKNVSFSASSWINPVNNSFNLTLDYGNQ